MCNRLVWKWNYILWVYGIWLGRQLSPYMKPLYFMSSFYCKQRFCMTGIAACLLQCFAVIQDFYFSLLDTRFSSIKVKYILKSPCSVASSGLLGKLYGLSFWARERKLGILTEIQIFPNYLGQCFIPRALLDFIDNSGLPIIIKL